MRGVATKPIILLTPDTDETPRRFVLQQTYVDAVLRAGGWPLIPPHGLPVEACLGLAHGLVVTGGAFDIPPEAYGEARRQGMGEVKDDRTRFEWALLEGALEAGLPVLGVCGGMQLLNVVLGGTLIQDIPTEVEGALPHEQPPPKDVPSHPITVATGSLLASATGGAQEVEVNSTHHQGVARLGRGLQVTARAPDGVVEAVEDPSRPYVVGVQWHPEAILASAPWNLEIYRQLVRAAKERAA